VKVHHLNPRQRAYALSGIGSLAWLAPVARTIYAAFWRKHRVTNPPKSRLLFKRKHGFVNPCLSANKKPNLSTRQIRLFWMMFAFGKWWRLHLMMFASRMMRGFATFGGKRRLIAERSGATSYLRSKCIISPQAMHHLTNRGFCDTITYRGDL